MTPLDVFGWMLVALFGLMLLAGAALIIGGTIAGIRSAAQKRQAPKSTQILPSHHND